MTLTRILAFTAALAMSTPAHSAVDAGRVIYNESCIQCHGDAGTGNPVADQFWKMRIPRLTEEYVQRKSDSELRHVMLNGKRKMPPAMMGRETAHRTKLTPVQVPDLTTYIRSLKKKS